MCFQVVYVNGVKFSVPEWEKKAQFNPVRAVGAARKAPHWRLLSGKGVQPSCPPLRFEEIFKKGAVFDVQSLPLRDPEHFVVGGLHRNLPAWEEVLNLLGQDFPQAHLVRGWLMHGVHIPDFFKRFEGDFKGKHYSSDEPPRAFFQNSFSCRDHVEFVASELEARLESGSFKLLGRIGDCVLPRLILPLTVEPTKPRLCHDERFLNLWIKDCPFRLENLKDLHRLIGPGAQMISTDEKSGYDHVRLSEGSQDWLGVQFAGWVLAPCTLPFGFKSSAFIFQTIGMVATSYLRSFDIPASQYIDDRFAAELVDIRDGRCLIDIDKVRYSVLELLTRLGYTLALHKSQLGYQTSLKHLGFIADSIKRAYFLPPEKKRVFSELREKVLDRKNVDLRTLQRLVGKCISFALVVPGAQLYTREMNAAISRCVRSSKNEVPLEGGLRREVEYWRFLDDWQDFCPWKEERHVQFVLATDASSFKFAGVVLSGTSKFSSFADFWEDDDVRPIHLKEASALLNCLRAVSGEIRNKRVDILTDNMALVHAWENKGGKDLALVDIVKEIFQLVLSLNVSLNLMYVRSKDNVADAPSRSVSLSHVTLSANSWKKVQDAFGPHSFDLMALGSNVMKDAEGRPLPFYAPFPLYGSEGVNLFAQTLVSGENYYVFPPEEIIFPTLLHLLSNRVERCTVVLPSAPGHMWAPFVGMYSTCRVCLGQVGDIGVLRIPSKKGYLWDIEGLKHSLYAHRFCFV